MAGTPTPNYNWPLPALTDPPDGPAQIAALGNAIDATVKPIDTRSVNTETALAAKMPYASHGARQSVTFSGNTWRPAAFTFPVGRFTVAPVVVANAEDGNAFGVALIQVAATASGVTIAVRRTDNTAWSGQMGVTMLAFQMTASTGPGRSAVTRLSDDPEYRITCHTPECDNAGQTLTLQLPEADTPVVCGGCDRPITDVSRA